MEAFAAEAKAAIGSCRLWHSATARFGGTRRCSSSGSPKTGPLVPVADDPNIGKRPMLAFSAGYIMRSIDEFPQQGTSGPWTIEMDYRADIARLRKGPVDDPALRFSSADRPVAAAAR